MLILLNFLTYETCFISFSLLFLSPLGRFFAVSSSPSIDLLQLWFSNQNSPINSLVHCPNALDPSEIPNFNKIYTKFQFSKKPPIITLNLTGFSQGFLLPPSNPSFYLRDWKGRTPLACNSGHARSYTHQNQPFNSKIGFPKTKALSMDMNLHSQKLKSLACNLDPFPKNESKLADFSLLAKFVQGPVDFRQVMGKLKTEWKNLKGQFLCDDIGNEWLIIKFANKEDRNQVWENRPYHVQGHLLALYQWHESFDPTLHDTTSVDLWLRIPGIPHQLLTPNAIELILRENGVGRLIRLDPASNIRNKLKFVRCCVNVDLTRSLVCSVNILKANGSLLTLRVWYEDFSDGCGCCGGADHAYDDCPINKPQPRKFQVILDENPHHDVMLSLNKNPPSSPTGPLKNTPSNQKNPLSEPNTWSPTLPTTITDLATPSIPTVNPNAPLPNLLPNNCSLQMINSELLRHYLALHNSNPSIPHPLENLALPIERPLSPKNKNCNANVNVLDSSLEAVVAQQLAPQVDSSDHSNDDSNNSTKSETTIVKKMENVAIKSAVQSSNDAEAAKRKEDQDNKEISSPSTKRLRKKKN